MTKYFKPMLLCPYCEKTWTIVCIETIRWPEISAHIEKCKDDTIDSIDNGV